MKSDINSNNDNNISMNNSRQVVDQITILQNKLRTININNTFSRSIDLKTLSWFTDGSCHNNGKKSSTGGFAAICVSGYKQNSLIYGKVDN